MLFNNRLNDRPLNYSTRIRFSHQADTTGKEFTADLDYADYRNNQVQQITGLNYDANGNFADSSGTLMNQQRHLQIYAIKMDYVHPLKNNVRLEAGWKSSYVRAANDIRSYDIQQQPDTSRPNFILNEEQINAAYLSYNKQFKRISLQAGIRTEQTITKGAQSNPPVEIRQNYWQLFPSFFLMYRIDQQNNLNLKAGRRTERAAYAEMTPFRRPLSPTLYFQGNPNLKPQLSYHAELTYGYRNKLFFTMGYDLYNDYVRTLPFLDSNKTTITRIPSNIHKASAWNIDIAYSGRLTSWWTTDNTLSFYNNSFNGQVRDFRLNNSGIVSLRFNSNNKFTLTRDLTGECNVEYNTRWQLVHSSFGPYAVLNLGVRQQLFAGKGSLVLNINNLLQSEDHNVIDRYEYFKQVSYWYFNTRSINLGFSWRFGSGKLVKTASSEDASEEQKRSAAR